MQYVEAVVGGTFSATSYIIRINEECWLVDCGDYSALIGHLTTPVKGILLTHGHFDHIRGLNELLIDHPLAKVYTNRVGREMLMDARKNLSHYHDSDFTIGNPSLIEIVNDRDMVYLGDKRFAQAVYTPGHNPSCITWIIDDSLFTGDSFIPGIKTVTKLPGGNKQDNIQSLDIIKNFSIGRKIHPGHKIEL